MQYVKGGERLFLPAGSAASKTSSRVGSGAGRRSAAGSTADFSSVKTVTFNDDNFDASTVVQASRASWSARTEGDHDHQGSPDNFNSSRLQFFFNGRLLQYSTILAVVLMIAIVRTV